jgi:hypothetical protein
LARGRGEHQFGNGRIWDRGVAEADRVMGR